MLKDLLRKFFEKPQAETARELYYRQVKTQYLKACRLVEFMRAARRQGCTMELIIEVDGVICDSGKIILERKEGRDLEEYIANWLMGMAFKYAEEVTEMATLWPEMAKDPVPVPKAVNIRFSDWE